MKIQKHYIIIPLVTIAVALLGSLFNAWGMSWYDTQLLKPELTPPKWVFPVAWNLIFLLTTISAIMVVNHGKIEDSFWKNIFTFGKARDNYSAIIDLFITNAFLNVLWSLLFFTFHWIFIALVEMIILLLTVLVLIKMIWRLSKVAALLLLPYAVWVSFATFLTYQILVLNG